jgi:hypothetical protein
MKLLLLSLSAAAALWSAACGRGNSIVTPPPPVGKYSLASLNGTFAFITSGEVFASGATTATPLARSGSFTANGTGGITGGIEDVVEPGVLPNLAIPITGGSYTVNADGRGTLTLDLTAAGVPSSINFGMVLTSTSDGLLIDETSTSAQASTGSGNFIKQNSSFFTSPILPVTASYVFDFSGLDGNAAPASLVGEFTAGSGAISSGFEDANDNFSITSSAIPPGTLTQDPANPSTLTQFGRGTAQIAGETYVFYIVDSTRLRFISTGGGAMLSGDAVIQTNTIPANVSAVSSSFAFIVAGSSGSGGMTRVGRFTANGATVTNVLQDTNDAGKFILTNSTTSASISLDPANPGRGTFTFTDPHFASAPSTFVFYLSSATQGVIQEQTMNNTGAVNVADGTIAAQTGSPFSSANITGTYAISWSGLSVQTGSGFSVQDEEDLLGEVTVSGLALNGAADIFQFQSGAPATNLVASGSIVINGDGTSSGSAARNTMSVKLTQSNSVTVNFVIYFVSPQLAFFTNNQDANRTVAGVLTAQQ